MKRLAIGLILAANALAGTTPDVEVPVEPSSFPPEWLKPTLDVRLRAEYGSIDVPGLKDATAITGRARAGLEIGPFAGFSAFAEYEGTWAMHDHYTTPVPTSPGLGSQAGIADPESSALNRAWVRWEGYDSMVKGGRQRIIYDNAAFIGHVGWRQNEQTYDGVAIDVGALDNFMFRYAWIDRVNRIFGSDAVGAARNFSGNTHLFNANWAPCDEFTLASYIYLMDFDRTGQAFSNNTYGIWTEAGIPLPGDWNGRLHAELAWQTDAGSTPVDYEAFYGHLFFSTTYDCHKITLGYEHLGEDLGRNKLTGAPVGISARTPLATVHKFNGFSDAFLGTRIGGRPGGLGDLYLSYSTTLPWKIKFLTALHWFGEDDFSFDRGWEFDLVFSRKFLERFTAIAKLGAYDSHGGIRNPAPFDVLRASVEVNFAY